ncbi:hypothetical protein [Bradyrhizobium australafricanum]|uniref:hypothetical protein n=1 Tax=Bradyrhizobium australafricanum TaxID=2821406 RepID=UPI001CE2339C|nr:hypothetical protein [Bradyrhizobium australafricanum]MCA6104893.1 hypothetical protein [Bradyrhizobium australafricanum]
MAERQRPCRRQALYQQSGAVPLLALLVSPTPAARNALVKAAEDRNELVLYPEIEIQGRLRRLCPGIHIGCTHDGNMLPARLI